MAVVSDSTAYLPDLRGLGVGVVPCQVVIGGRSRPDDEVSPGELTAALRSGDRVTTSGPAVEAFVDVYRRLAAEGSPDVVSVHVSAEVSGTVGSARVAAQRVADEGVRVEVVDSRLVGMGLGCAIRAAVEAAGQGAVREEVAAAAAARAGASRVWLYVDTLEYLRRGGRIGAASALVGSALAVKPLLALVDGRIEAVDRVRTGSRALARLVELVTSAVQSGGRYEVWVQHLAAPDRAAGVAGELAARLADRLVPVGMPGGEGASAGVSSDGVSEVGAVVGAHVGPGMVGVTLSRVG